MMPDNIQTLSDKEKKSKDLCEEFFRTGLDDRIAHEITWYRNIAFFLGHQYLVWDQARRLYYMPAAPRYRVRHVENRLKPTALHVVAKLTKNRPVSMVLPARMDDDAAQAAHCGQVILRHIHKLNTEDILNIRLWFLAYLYGTAYKDLYFDESLGPKMVYSVDESGNLKFKNIGDVKVEVISPFHIVKERGAVNEDECHMIGKISIKSLEYIRKRYPKYGGMVKPEDVTNISSMESQVYNLLDKTFTPSNLNIPKENDGQDKQTGFACIKELRIKTSDEYPRGRIIRMANGIYLEETTLPYKFMYDQNHLGLIRHPFIDIPGSWYGDTPYNDLIPLQMRLNRNLSSIQEIINMMGKPKYLAPKQAELSRNAVNNEFEVIEYNANPAMPAPSVIPASESSITAVKASNDDRNEAWDEVSMMHETTRGGRIPGVDSNVAMVHLEEQDQTVYQPFLTGFENREEIMGRNKLMLVKEMWIEPRLLQVMGKNKEVEIYHFMTTEDLPTTVAIVPGSSFPVSLAARQQSLFQGLQAGAFGKAEEIPWDLRISILSSINMIDTESIFEEMLVDKRYAREEQHRWKLGAIEAPDLWDNHAVHIRQHDLFRKSEDYRRIRRTNPKLALMIDQHISIHMEADPAYVQNQQMQAEKQRLINIENNKTALENMIKEAEYKGKITEQQLAILRAMGLNRGPISEQQTVKE